MNRRVSSTKRQAKISLRHISFHIFPPRCDRREKTRKKHGRQGVEIGQLTMAEEYADLSDGRTISHVNAWEMAGSHVKARGASALAVRFIFAKLFDFLFIL
ncbi:MAG: hypothetical protein IJW70_02835 [Clostridia bacterium]|nr:hypothetical protein [Clostridia bacterium]